MEADNVYAVVNRWRNRVEVEASSYQEASSAENDLSGEWLAGFVGPQPTCISLPFTVCRIDALARFYPGCAR